MTAQGEGLLAWLDSAITAAEQNAPRWHDTECTVHGTSLIDATVLHSATLCDCGGPESVLRRCAADRRLLVAHGPWTDEERVLIGEPASDRSCKGCGFNNQEEPMVADYRDCPVLLALAEGYGWTGDKR